METQRRNWTNDDITKAIFEVVDFLGVDRMPTIQEMDIFHGDTGLSNKVCKTGGVYVWAENLGLKVKQSETKIGLENEVLVMKILKNQDFDCEMTSTRHPYDLLVDGCVKVDVKAARPSKVHGSDCYSFRLAKPQQTCDVYVAVCMNDDKEPQKIYIIPAHIMNGKTQLAVGVEHSKYDSFLYRWDIISQFSKAFANIK